MLFCSYPTTFLLIKSSPNCLEQDLENCYNDYLKTVVKPDGFLLSTWSYRSRTGNVSDDHKIQLVCDLQARVKFEERQNSHIFRFPSVAAWTNTKTLENFNSIIKFQSEVSLVPRSSTLQMHFIRHAFPWRFVTSIGINASKHFERHCR